MADWKLVHSRLYSFLMREYMNIEHTREQAKSLTSKRLSLLKVKFFNGVDVEKLEKHSWYDSKENDGRDVN